MLALDSNADNANAYLAACWRVIDVLIYLNMMIYRQEIARAHLTACI